jgi:DNA-directed RNA polymerase I subunit RPA1
LTSLARVFTVFLQTYGFTCGLDDLVINRKFDKLRRDAIEEGHRQGLKAAAEFCSIQNYEPGKMNLSNRVIN